MSRDARGGPLRGFRIVRQGYPPFDGAGAAKRGGRWNSPGKPVIYAAETYALAVLENLVHFNIGELPPKLVYVEITVPSTVSREMADPSALVGWDRPVAGKVSQAFGDRWLDEMRTAVLIVPSLLSPRERNLLIHPTHPQMREIHTSAPRRLHLDSRLARILSPPRSTD